MRVRLEPSRGRADRKQGGLREETPVGVWPWSAGLRRFEFSLPWSRDSWLGCLGHCGLMWGGRRLQGGGALTPEPGARNSRGPGTW